MSPPSLRHPGRWLWLFLLVPALFGLNRLKLDVDVLGLLPGDLKVVQGLRLYQRHFANAQELIITVEAPDAETTEVFAKTLATRLREKADLADSVLWQPPWLEHPDQAAEIIAYLWFNQPPEALAELSRRLSPDDLPTLLRDAREQLSTSMSPGDIARLSYDPFGFTRLPEQVAGAAPAFGETQDGFSSADGRFRALFIQASSPLRNYRECGAWLKRVHQVVAEVQAAEKPKGDSIRVGYTGSPAFVAEVSSGMQRDITASVVGTSLIIAFLFYLAHRRVKPMLWLLTLLAVILASTFALGGLVFGTLNVVSFGFAAILLGLAVDYAVVHYQEALAHPFLTVPQIRRAIAPSIFWAAVTTIAAFLVLNFGGLPGLAQLGSLVGLGVGLAALIMVFEFLPPLFPERNQAPGSVADPGRAALDETGQSALRPQQTGTGTLSSSAPLFGRKRALVFTGLLAGVSGLVLSTGFPRVDPSAEPLRPRNSQAYAAMRTITKNLGGGEEPFWVVVRAGTDSEMAQELNRLQSELTLAVTNGILESFSLPTVLWPNPEYQAANAPVAREMVSRRKVFREAALSNGFSERSLALAEGVLATFEKASSSKAVFLPHNELSQWIFRKFTSRDEGQKLAIGLLRPPASGQGSFDLAGLRRLETNLRNRDISVSGWPLLGGAIFARVRENLWKVVGPMVVLVLFSLILAFRRWTEVMLSIAVLTLSTLCLLMVMRIAGWSWNLLNLMAVPLVLGTGVDYGIFMQLALRRHQGDVKLAYRSVGRALLLCGGTAIAGFGSLALSSNAGMASLGVVCAVGIGFNMLISIYLLPSWWKLLRESGIAGKNAPAGPSSLYRADLWRTGRRLVRILPRSVCLGIGWAAANIYWVFARHRRAVVVANLLPALVGDVRTAKRVARRLFQEMGIKVCDLLRYESGTPIGDLLGESSGFEHIEAARQRKQGTLLITPHLGNWEFGAAWLARSNVDLHVITLAEPGTDFTQVRQAARARWNISTSVIANDMFGFIEIIRKLEAGATVALLLDRPPAGTGVVVELFGRPFLASMAPAELARATGCLLLPVYVPRTLRGYCAHVLTPVEYQRATLRDPIARRELIQKLMFAFEPLIREHIDQWFHFVPIWPDVGPAKKE